MELVPAEDGYMQGDVVSNIFKGVHYELEVKANGYDWMVHTTKYVEVGSHVGIRVIPFNIQVMHKPESSDEKAVEIDAVPHMDYRIYHTSAFHDCVLCI